MPYCFYSAYTVNVDPNGALLSTGGTDIGNHGDDIVTAGISIGFDFTFYHDTYNTINLSSNGNAQFITTFSQLFDAGYSPIPDTVFGPTIFPYWSDLTTVTIYRPDAGIFVQTTGSAPYRVFSVVWKTEYWDFSGNVDFELKLYETTNVIQVITGNIDPANPPTTGAAYIQMLQEDGTYYQIESSGYSYNSGVTITFSGVCDATAITPTPTETITPTPTNTPSETPTQTPTNSQTPTSTITNTPTNTQTPSITQSQTQTQTPTNSVTPTNTPTNTTTQTPTTTKTPSPTPVNICVEYSYTTRQEASTECPGNNDEYQDYVFTVKDLSNNPITSPVNISVQLSGNSDFPSFFPIYVNINQGTTGNTVSVNTIQYYNFPVCNYYSSEVTSITIFSASSGNVYVCNALTPTPTNTQTPTTTPTNTQTSTPTTTPTNTQTSTPTNTQTPAATNTSTPTMTITPTNTQTLTPTNSETPGPTVTPTTTATVTQTLGPIVQFRDCSDGTVYFRFLGNSIPSTTGLTYYISGGNDFVGCATVVPYTGDGPIFPSDGVSFTNVIGCNDYSCPTDSEFAALLRKCSDGTIHYFRVNIGTSFVGATYLYNGECYSFVEFSGTGGDSLGDPDYSDCAECSLNITPTPTPSITPTINVTPTSTVTPTVTPSFVCPEDCTITEYCLSSDSPILSGYNGNYVAHGGYYNSMLYYEGGGTSYGVIYFNGNYWCLSDTIGGSCILRGSDPCNTNCPDLLSSLFSEGFCPSPTPTPVNCDILDFNAYFDCEYVEPNPPDCSAANFSVTSLPVTPTPSPTRSNCDGTGVEFTIVSVGDVSPTPTPTPSQTPGTIIGVGGVVSFTMFDEIFTCSSVKVLIDCNSNNVYYTNSDLSYGGSAITTGTTMLAEVNGVPLCVTYDRDDTNYTSNAIVTNITSVGDCTTCSVPVSPTPTPTASVTPTLTSTPTPSVTATINTSPYYTVYVYESCTAIGTIPKTTQVIQTTQVGFVTSVGQTFKDNSGVCWKYNGSYLSSYIAPSGYNVITYTGNYFVGVNTTLYPSCSRCLGLTTSGTVTTNIYINYQTLIYQGGITQQIQWDVTDINSNPATVPFDIPFSYKVVWNDSSTKNASTTIPMNTSQIITTEMSVNYGTNITQATNITMSSPFVFVSGVSNSVSIYKYTLNNTVYYINFNVLI